MKRAIFFLVAGVFLLAGTQAFALDPLGPPSGSLNKGQVSAGVEFIMDEMDLSRSTASWSSATKNAYDIDSSKVFAKLAYGVSDNWEIYLRVGSVVDFEADQP